MWYINVSIKLGSRYLEESVLTGVLVTAEHMELVPGGVVQLLQLVDVVLLRLLHLLAPHPQPHRPPLGILVCHESGEKNILNGIKRYLIRN